MDFENLSHVDLDLELIRGLLVSKETRTVVVQGQLFVDSVLEYMCRKKLPHPDVFFSDRTDFMTKLRLARALGLISERQHGAFRALNKLRNKFAHSWDYEPTIEDSTPMNFDLSDTEEKELRALRESSARGFTLTSTLYLCDKARNLAKPIGE